MSEEQPTPVVPVVEEETRNPVTLAVWRKLCPIAQEMIRLICDADATAFEMFNGTVLFTIRQREVITLTPAPELRRGHEIPVMRGRIALYRRDWARERPEPATENTPTE